MRNMLCAKPLRLENKILYRNLWIMKKVCEMYEIYNQLLLHIYYTYDRLYPSQA
jgi:hypothetical protein